MDEAIDNTLGRVIAAMYERLGEELTMDDLARTAMYSKFHFSRMFRRATGVSPGRFLSAVRFQEAKRLLGTTTLSVAEISNLVGYSSLGTFSTRFKKCVGLTPTEYRQSGGRPAERLAAIAAGRDDTGLAATVSGRICVTEGIDCGATFIGLFGDPVPHGAPVSCTVLTRPGRYVLDGVPEGTWYVVSQGVLAGGTGARDDTLAERPSLAGRSGPVRVQAGAGVTALDDVLLRPMRVIDVPVLPAPFTDHPARASLAGSGAAVPVPGRRIHPIATRPRAAALRAS